MTMHSAHCITMQGAEHHCISTGAALCVHYIAQYRANAASLHQKLPNDCTLPFTATEWPAIDQSSS